MTRKCSYIVQAATTQFEPIKLRPPLLRMAFEEEKELYFQYVPVHALFYIHV